MNCIGLIAQFVLITPGPANEYPPLPDFQKRVNYVQWLENALPEINDENNAYTAYAQFMPGLTGSTISQSDWPAFEGMLTTKNIGPENNPPMGPAPWHPERKPVWEASFKRTLKILKEYDAAAERKKLVPPCNLDGQADDQANLIRSFPLPYLIHLRQCSAGMLEAAWRVRIDKVSPSRFYSAIETNLRVANQMRGSVFAIEHTVACRIRTLTYEHIRWAFAHGVFTEKHAPKIAKLLRTIDKDPIDASPTLIGECLMWLDALQYVYGPLGGGLTLNGIRYKEITGQNMGGSNRFGIGARIERDPQGAAKAILDAHVAMEQHMQPGFTTDHYQSLGVLAVRMRDANRVNKGLMLGLGANYGRFYADSAACEAERRATRLIVELFAYKNKKDKWPEKLSELGMKVPDGIKRDVYRDEAFVYVLRDNRPTLYSVAQNGTDDGGRHNARDDFAGGGDYVFWPIPDSEELLAASRLNCIPDKNLTPLSAIGADLKGQTVTIAAEVSKTSSLPSQEHGQRHSVILTQDDTTIELVYYQSVADKLSPNQQIKPGIRVRVKAQVEKDGDLWLLMVDDPKHIAIED